MSCSELSAPFADYLKGEPVVEASASLALLTPRASNPSC